MREKIQMTDKCYCCCCCCWWWWWWWWWLCAFWTVIDCKMCWG